MNICIKGRIPSKKNSKQVFCPGKGRPIVTASKAHKEWHADASEQLAKQKLKKIECSKAHFVLYAPDKRKADLSNKWESVADLLVDNGIIEDDNWFVLEDIHMLFGGVDKDNPRCVVELD